jgi:hypothetical protein
MSRLKQVTQITSKTTAVRINAFNGSIETVSLTDAGAATFTFTVNNTKVRAISNIQLTSVYNGNGKPLVIIGTQTEGSFTIRVTNLGSGALNAPLRINFGVV